VLQGNPKILLVMADIEEYPDRRLIDEIKKSNVTFKSLFSHSSNSEYYKTYLAKKSETVKK